MNIFNRTLDDTSSLIKYCIKNMKKNMTGTKKSYNTVAWVKMYMFRYIKVKCIKLFIYYYSYYKIG